MNGFHDAANSIATVVSTGVLKPAQAIVFAAFFNVVAIFIFHLSVAATVGKGIVQPGIVDTHVVFGALVGAIMKASQGKADGKAVTALLQAKRS
jgi:PiT family inorganic phosphate transporter